LVALDPGAGEAGFGFDREVRQGIGTAWRFSIVPSGSAALAREAGRS
jgi:hypothetical protein